MTLVFERQKRSFWSKWLDKLSFSSLLAISLTMMFLHLWQTFVLKGILDFTGLFVYSTWMGLIVVCFFLYWQDSPRRQLNRLQNWLSQQGLAPLVGFVGAIIFVFDSLSLPVMAQTAPNNPQSTGFFFTNIQNKVTGIFANSPQAASINPIILFAFGVLQVLFIMYIAWQIAKVIGSAREEEDWKQAAKTPLIVAAAVVGGDFAVGLV